MKNTCRCLVPVTLSYVSPLANKYAFHSLFLSLRLSFYSSPLRISVLCTYGSRDPLERVRRTLLYSRHISLEDRAALAKIDPFHEITRAATNTRQRVRIPM